MEYIRPGTHRRSGAFTAREDTPPVDGTQWRAGPSCLALAAWVVPGFDVGGPVAAFLAALVVSAVGWVLAQVLGDDRELALRRRDRPPRPGP